MTQSERPPNLVLLITDQQRQPQHWPQDPAWLDALCPNDAELRRTGMTFTQAFTATAMCSPSRASFLTGTYPSRHGVSLTLTEGDLYPDPRNSAATLRAGAALALSGEGLDMRAMLAESLQMGDEGHNRNKAGSILYTARLAPFIVRTGADKETAGRVLQFLVDNALSVLNPVMAACKAMADAGHGVEGSTIMTAMARNGTELGIRVSGLGSRWFTGPAQVPDGLYFPGFTRADANRDIGDSTITETAGIGAFAMAGAPAIVSFVGGSPRDAAKTTLEMYEITVAEHPHFAMPALDFRGTPVGVDIRKVVELGILPRINTGIAHREAGIGQVGAGLALPPMEAFEKALMAFAEEYLE